MYLHVSACLTRRIAECDCVCVTGSCLTVCTKWPRAMVMWTVQTTEAKRELSFKVGWVDMGSQEWHSMGVHGI